MPAIFILKITVVGHDYLSEQIEKFPLFVNDQSSNIDSKSKHPEVTFLQVKNNAKNTLDYGFIYKPICNHPFKICSKYNINSLHALLIVLTFQI